MWDNDIGVHGGDARHTESRNFMNLGKGLSKIDDVQREQKTKQQQQQKNSLISIFQENILSGCVFESLCCHLKFTYNSEMCTWHNNNIQTGINIVLCDGKRHWYSLA